MYKKKIFPVMKSDKITDAKFDLTHLIAKRKNDSKSNKAKRNINI